MSFVKRQGTIAFLDGAGSPAEFFSCGTDDIGDLSASDLMHLQRQAIAIINRGGFKGYVFGDDQPISLSFTYRPPIQTFTKSDADRILDVVYKTGLQGSAPVTTDNPIAGGPFSFKVKITYTDGTTTASILFSQCHVTASLDESGDTLQIKLSFTSYGVPTLA